MADIVQDGQTASWSTVYNAFQQLRATGQQVLDSLAAARVDLIVELEQSLEQLNGKRQLASRIPTQAVAARFLVSDFADIDQAQTTATVRADTKSVTLRERPTPADATIRSTTFSTSDGTIGEVNGIYRVTTAGGNAPLGVFKLVLSSAYNLSLVTFDILSMPANPVITVKTSADDVLYTEAPSVSQNGYQVTAWFPPASVRYIRLEIRPSHPDALGGNVYSFGITDFAARAVQFNLASELVFSRVTAAPASAFARFVADPDPNLTYFLSWNGDSFFQVKPGDVITLPETELIDHAGVGLDIYGQLAEGLPANVYPATLSITDLATGAPYRLAPGMVMPPYGTSHGYMMIPEPPAAGPIILAPYEEPENPPLFRLVYQTGPSSLNVWLRVQLATSDPSLSPVFHGAVLQNL